MYRLGAMSELHGGGGRPGEKDAVLIVGTDGSGDDSVSEAPASLDSGSLCSSTLSSLTDDDSQSSPPVGGRAWSSSSSLGEDTTQLDGDGGGPLYELSPLLAHLPVRTGLSKYYKGKSQSFTSLSNVKYLQDLPKKTISHIRRIKASPSSLLHHVRGRCSKMIAKTTTPWGSSDQMLSRARSRGLLDRSSKPPAYQSKKNCAVHMLAKMS